jgi:hypothetical protein
MKITLTNTSATLTREPGDKRLPTENSVTHAIKILLIAQGIPAARVRGNVGLTSCTQVLRLKGLHATLWHERYQVESANEAFNKDGAVTYQRVDDDDRTDFEAQGLDFPLRAELANDTAN